MRKLTTFCKKGLFDNILNIGLRAAAILSFTAYVVGAVLDVIEIPASDLFAEAIAVRCVGVLLVFAATVLCVFKRCAESVVCVLLNFEFHNMWMYSYETFWYVELILAIKHSALETRHILMLLGISGVLISAALLAIFGRKKVKAPEDTCLNDFKLRRKPRSKLALALNIVFMHVFLFSLFLPYNSSQSMCFIALILKLRQYHPTAILFIFFVFMAFIACFCRSGFGTIANGVTALAFFLLDSFLRDPFHMFRGSGKNMIMVSILGFICAGIITYLHERYKYYISPEEIAEKAMKVKYNEVRECYILLNEGIITVEEFENKKQKIMNK